MIDIEFKFFMRVCESCANLNLFIFLCRQDLPHIAYFTLILNPYPANTESLCHQYIATPACTSLQLAGQHQVLILISLKQIMEIAKNVDGLFHLRNSAW